MKIWAKTKEWAEGKFLVVRRDGTAPHWPHFVLGARDPNAPTALRAYASECEKAFMDQEYVDSVRLLATDFEEYRAAHGAGDPEAPPHRHDDPAVLQAMRGKQARIWVRPDEGNTRKAIEAASHLKGGQT